MCAICSGCSTTCTVEVSATCSEENFSLTNAGVVFKLIPQTSTLVTDDSYQKFSAQVHHVLLQRGFVPVIDTGQEQADITIKLDYNISAPIKIEYLYETSAGRGPCSCLHLRCTCILSYGIYNDTYLRTGFYYVYRRDLSLEARTTIEGSAPPAWTLRASSTGRSDDLDLVFPVLLASCAPYIATNSSEIVRKRTNAPEVLSITHNSK